MIRKIIEILVVLTLAATVVLAIKQEKKLSEVSDTLVAMQKFDAVTYQNVIALIHNTELLEKDLRELKKRIEI